MKLQEVEVRGPRSWRHCRIGENIGPAERCSVPGCNEPRGRIETLPGRFLLVCERHFQWFRFFKKLGERISGHDPKWREPNSDIVCPFCGEVQAEIWDIGRVYEEGTIDVECQECERDFQVSVSVSFTYESDFPEDDGS